MYLEYWMYIRYLLARYVDIRPMVGGLRCFCIPRIRKLSFQKRSDAAAAQNVSVDNTLRRTEKGIKIK